MDARAAQLFAAMDAADAELAKAHAELVKANEHTLAVADNAIRSIRNQGLSCSPTRSSSQINGRTFNGVDRPRAA
jgi:hypothetical protein